MLFKVSSRVSTSCLVHKIVVVVSGCQYVVCLCVRFADIS